MCIRDRLYDPLVAAPGPDGQRVAHIELFNLHRLSNAADWIDMDMIQAEYESFQPYYDWQFVLDNNRRPAPVGVRQAVRIGGGLSEREDCWVDYGTTDAEYYCFFDEHYADFVPEYGPQDYVATVFGFNGALSKDVYKRQATRATIRNKTEIRRCMKTSERTSDSISRTLLVRLEPAGEATMIPISAGRILTLFPVVRVQWEV